MTVAVAVALYNGERFVKEQLDSLRKQTRMPDRVVLCDDGSKDKTVEIVREYIKEYGLEQTWTLEINPQNLGYIKNFYRAMSLCDTDLIFLCDQDDVWGANKIEKMTQVLESREDILLLSCKGGIVDSEGNPIKSVMHKEAKEDESLSPVSVRDIMSAYRWPGMLMCIRKDFFNEIYSSIAEIKLPHDLAFTICAADKNGFYDYNYIGAYHRRHDNNTAREEHRVSKLLDLNRKIKDIVEASNYMTIAIEANLPIGDKSYKLIKYKLDYLNNRKDCLENRRFKKLIQLYRGDKEHMFRLASVVCDIWIVLFGNYGGKHDKQN